MWGLLFFVLTFLSVQANRKNSYEVLVHEKNQFNFTTNNAGSVLDPNHQLMLGVENGTIYTQADINAINANAIAYFQCYFGVNFSSVPVDPFTGIRFMPGVGTFIPYQDGLDKTYRWLMGSKDDSVFLKDKWYIFDVGVLLLFSNDGVFPGGVMSNTTFKNQSIVAYTQYTYIKEIENNKNRGLDDIRIIRTMNREISYQVPNELGFAQQLLIEYCINEKGVAGDGHITVSVQQRPQKTGTIVQRNRAVLTFDSTKPDQISCPTPWVGSKWTRLQEMN